MQHKKILFLISRFLDGGINAASTNRHEAHPEKQKGKIQYNMPMNMWTNSGMKNVRN